ncbi:glycosyltransferase family 2 protein [Olsenella sp. KGMB02461]|nr:glycosyltransferase family 2 protein [Olsenella sp. KGMB02461]
MLSHEYNKMQLSVVIPAYQAESTIRETLESLLKTPSKDFEVIVVNDGSTDRTGEILLDISANDSRVNIITQKNMGRSAARNAGLQAASGQWIMFLDADDCFLPNWKAGIDQVLSNNTADLAVFGYLKDGELPSKLKYDELSQIDSVAIPAKSVLDKCLHKDTNLKLPFQNLFEWNAVWGRLYSSKVINILKKCIGSSLFPVGVKFSEDYYFNILYLNAIASKGEVEFVYSPLYQWNLSVSQTVSVNDVNDPDSLLPYETAVNSCTMFDENEKHAMMAKEIAQQFRRSATLDVKYLPQAARVWHRVVKSLSISQFTTSVPEYWGTNKWVYYLPALFWKHAHYQVALFFIHYIDKACKILFE